MAPELDVANGLFDWINSLRLAEPVDSPQNLSDGRLIWKVLRQIDRLSFPGGLPENVEAGHWVHKWTNLKHVYDALSIFLIEECDQRLPLPSGGPDLKAIAQSASLSDTIALLKLVVIAAINCRDRIKYLEKMQTLAEPTQEILMATAQEAEENDPTGAGDDETDPNIEAIIGIDSELASEERLSKVIADNQRIAHEKRDLQNQFDEMQRRITKMQAAHENTLEELKETNERLTAVLSGSVDIGSAKVVDPKQESVIAALESRLLAAEQENEDIRRSNEVLKIKAEKVQNLQDDLDEAKIDRDRLSRKANAAEKYKQKLESIQDVEKENIALRNRISDLQNQLKQSDSTQVSSSDLAREIDEYRRLLPSIEQERYELNEMKKRLEFDYHTLEARHQDTLEQFQRQQKALEELQSRLRDYEEGLSPSTPNVDRMRDLESLSGDFATNEAVITEILMVEEDDVQNQISEDELRSILSAMRAQAQADSALERGLGKQIEKRLLGAISRGFERQARLKSHIQQQTNLIKSLQSTAAKPTQGSATISAPPSVTPSLLASAQSSSSETKLDEARILNENLKRELRLMTSAWYNQNSRLLSSGALISRARPSLNAQSFLAKQRKLVGNVMLGQSSGS